LESSTVSARDPFAFDEPDLREEFVSELATRCIFHLDVVGEEVPHL
jgi:hypothetical protein